MAYVRSPAAMANPPAAPAVRRIGVSDIGRVLRSGWSDFWAMPTHVMFLVIIYPITGLVIARVTMGENLLPLAYPLIAGFALLGPFAALGVYELSRRREQGLASSWMNAFDVLRSPSWGSIAVLGLLQMVLFVAWIATAQTLYVSLLGDAHPHSIGELIGVTLTTSAGWALIVLGNGLGFLFAVAALTLSVVSLPLLLDRPVGAVTALTTSIEAVRINPLPMAVWGLVIAAALAVGSIPLFIGLAVALPVLGHATWHLYREVVVPADPSKSTVGRG